MASSLGPSLSDGQSHHESRFSLSQCDIASTSLMLPFHYLSQVGESRSYAIRSSFSSFFFNLRLEVLMEVSPSVESATIYLPISGA